MCLCQFRAIAVMTWSQDTPVDELRMGRLNLKKDLSERTGQLKSLVRV